MSTKSPSTWMLAGEAPLVLASQSPGRAAMLRAAGLVFTTAPARIDETALIESMVAEGVPPRDIADALAGLKCMAVARAEPGSIVIGADQILVCDGTIFEKPGTREKAFDQLKALQGKTHQLISAIVVARDGGIIWRHVDTASLDLRPMADATISAYLDAAGDDILQSVGCYHVEGLGAQLFTRINGDHFTIRGLPLLPLLDLLRRYGIIAT